MSQAGVIDQKSPGARGPRDWRRLFFLMSLAAAAVCAVACLLSFWPGAAPAAAGFLGPLLGLSILVNVRTVFLVWQIQQRPGGGKEAASAYLISVWYRNRWLWGLCALAGVLIVSGILFLGSGQPMIVNGHYVDNVHGTMSPISYGTYIRELGAGTRLFCGAALALLSFAAAVNATPAPRPIENLPPL